MKLLNNLILGIFCISLLACQQDKDTKVTTTNKSNKVYMQVLELDSLQIKIAGYINKEDLEFNFDDVGLLHKYCVDYINKYDDFKLQIQNLPKTESKNIDLDRLQNFRKIAELQKQRSYEIYSHLNPNDFKAEDKKSNLDSNIQQTYKPTHEEKIDSTKQEILNNKESNSSSELSAWNKFKNYVSNKYNETIDHINKKKKEKSDMLDKEKADKEKSKQNKINEYDKLLVELDSIYYFYYHDKSFSKQSFEQQTHLVNKIKHLQKEVFSKRAELLWGGLNVSLKTDGYDYYFEDSMTSEAIFRNYDFLVKDNNYNCNFNKKIAFKDSQLEDAAEDKKDFNTILNILETNYIYNSHNLKRLQVLLQNKSDSYSDERDEMRYQCLLNFNKSLEAQRTMLLNFRNLELKD